MPSYKVSSEIYSECDYRTKKSPKKKDNVVSEFPFKFSVGNEVVCDEDGDLIVGRKNGVIQIEHSISTDLPLVGLQVWRGALLLADLVLHSGLKGDLNNKNVLELGAGTGLTSFVAAMFAKRVVCTDINLGGILDLIKENVIRNKELIKSEFLIKELDFTTEFSNDMQKELKTTDVVYAADVIYDDDLTASFMNVLEKLLNTPPSKTILIALEKRYVFTLTDMESVAPCYETFLSMLDTIRLKNVRREWTVEQVPIDFPQYFKYDRVKELVLWRVTSGRFPEK